MNEYELNSHRYRELKHFCLQYRDMKRELDDIRSGYLRRSFDSTSNVAIREVELKHALKLIETTAHDTEEFLAERILKIVTEDVNVKELTMSCSRECMEELRRRYFWLLSKKKGI